MDVKVRIDPAAPGLSVTITAPAMTDEVRALAAQLSNRDALLMAWDGETAVPLRGEDILRCYGEDKGVRVQTESGSYDLRERLYELEGRLDRGRRDLARLGASRSLRDPMAAIQDRRMLLDYQSRRLAHGLTGAMAGKRERFARLAATLDALSPLKVLGRGYSLARTGTGEILSSVDQVQPEDSFTLRLSDGTLDCRVEEKRRQ